MKLKTVTFYLTIFVACCCALPAHAKAAKPKKSTAGSGNTLTTAQFMSGFSATLKFGSSSSSSATLISGNINGDHVIANADLQSLVAYLHSGLGSTSPVTSSDNADIQAFLNVLKPGLGSVSSVTTNTESSGDGLVAFTNNSHLLSVQPQLFTIQPDIIPEPTSAILAGCGMAMLLAARRRFAGAAS
jgi:hypothetical protein